jgi:hypothetical protein
MIRVTLPFHLRTLAGLDGGDVEVEVPAPVTIDAVLEAIEARYPMLKGTIRDHMTKKRRPFVRFYACGEDLSNDPTNTPLPDAIVNGTEPLMVIGAIAGG